MSAREPGGTTPVEGFDFRWASVAPGRLALWHRPKQRAIRYLARAGCERVVTLLAEHEGARDIGAAVQEAGLEWSWIPLANGRPPRGRVELRVHDGLRELSHRLDAGESLLLHCSAGMHRTGMLAYALLRARGVGAAEAVATIAELRPVTEAGLTAERVAWGERTAAILGEPMPSITPDSDGFSPELRERIARAIHERYRRNQRSRKPDSDPAMQPWEELTPVLRASNLAQAADIGNKLRVIGCALGPAGPGAPREQLSAEQIERLAVLEHARWVAEREAAGWTLGPSKDVERKLTPYLVGWDELAEEIREYDRDAVRAIPDVLAEAGLALRRERAG